MRGKNEGSIYKAGGYWRAQVYLGVINGKPKFKQVQRRTRAEAALELEKLLAKSPKAKKQLFAFDGAGQLSVRVERHGVITIFFTSHEGEAA